jgi:hypothetical protein
VVCGDRRPGAVGQPELWVRAICQFGPGGSDELEPFDEARDLAAKDGPDPLLELEDHVAGKRAARQILRSEVLQIKKVYEDGGVVAAQGVAAGDFRGA